VTQLELQQQQQQQQQQTLARPDASAETRLSMFSRHQPLPVMPPLLLKSIPHSFSQPLALYSPTKKAAMASGAGIHVQWDTSSASTSSLGGPTGVGEYRFPEMISSSSRDLLWAQSHTPSEATYLKGSMSTRSHTDHMAGFLRERSAKGRHVHLGPLRPENRFHMHPPAQGISGIARPLRPPEHPGGGAVTEEVTA
jgi:hypothetical protein